MEPGETFKESPSGNKGMKIAGAAMLAFTLYYSVMALLGPFKKMDELNNEFAPGRDGKTGIDKTIASDSAYLAMLKQKAFLGSRVEMAETDSVYLTINIPDSTINLEISGVTVHSTRFSEIEVSRLLRKGDRYTIFSLLSSPLAIQKEVSSIKKEPLMISIAPKDTSEFQPDVVPDTAGSEQVNYILELAHGIRIYFYQEEEEGSFSTFRFDLYDRLRSISSTLKSVVTFSVPDYHPYIKVRLPREDARAIFRAIPGKGQIGIYL